MTQHQAGTDTQKNDFLTISVNLHFLNLAFVAICFKIRIDTDGYLVILISMFNV